MTLLFIFILSTLFMVVIPLIYLLGFSTAILMEFCLLLSVFAGYILVKLWRRLVKAVTTLMINVWRH